MTNSKTGKEASPFTGRVSADWIEQGVWLRQAGERFGTAVFAATLQEARDRFKSLREGETPEEYAISSRLSGKARDKELSARLIGDAKRAWTDYRTAEDCLKRDIWFRLAWEGELRAFGALGHPGADFEWIPVRSWFYLKQDAEDDKVVRGEGMTYWYVRVVEPSSPTPTQGGRTYKTGAPGRPSSKHIIRAELVRRAEAGELISTSLASEAVRLSDWLKRQHPDAAPMTAKTIQNELSEQWRFLKINAAK